MVKLFEKWYVWLLILTTIIGCGENQTNIKKSETHNTNENMTEPKGSCYVQELSTNTNKKYLLNLKLLGKNEDKKHGIWKYFNTSNNQLDSIILFFNDEYITKLDTNDYKIYETINEKGITLSLPKGWKLVEKNVPTVLLALKKECPEKDQFCSTLSVSKESNKYSLTLKEYAAKTKEIMLNEYSNLEYIEECEFYFNEKNTIFYIYKINEGGVKVICYTFIILIDNNFFLLTSLVGDNDKYINLKNKELMLNIFSTLEINETYSLSK